VKGSRLKAEKNLHESKSCDIAQAKGRHSLESGNPVFFWIPGQARNDKLLLERLRHNEGNSMFVILNEVKNPIKSLNY
jgi:hypothetical protein